MSYNFEVPLRCILLIKVEKKKRHVEFKNPLYKTSINVKWVP